MESTVPALRELRRLQVATTMTWPGLEGRNEPVEHDMDVFIFSGLGVYVCENEAVNDGTG